MIAGPFKALGTNQKQIKFNRSLGVVKKFDFPNVKRLTLHGVSRLRFSTKRQVGRGMAYGSSPFHRPQVAYTASMEMKVELSLNRININQLLQTAKNQAETLLKAEASAHNQAMGFAVGTFISLLPTPGFNFALALLLASWFRLNRATVLVSLAIWNVFVTAPFFALSYRLGNWLFPAPATASVAEQWQAQVISFVQGFLVGNLIIAGLVTAVSYTIVLFIVWLLRDKRSKHVTSVL